MSKSQTRHMRLENKSGQWVTEITIDGCDLTVAKGRKGAEMKEETYEFDSFEEAFADAKETYAELKSKGYSKAGKAEAEEEAPKSKKKKTGKKRAKKETKVISATVKSKSRIKSSPVVVAIADKNSVAEFYLAAKTGEEVMDIVDNMRDTLWEMEKPRCNEETLNSLIKDFPLVPCDPGKFKDAKVAIKIHPRRAGLVAYIDTPKGRATVAYDLVSKTDEDAVPKYFSDFCAAEDLDAALSGK